MWWLFPGYCLLCDRRTGRHLDLCGACERALPDNARPCRVCGLPATLAETGRCAQCVLRPPPFERTLAPYRYAAPMTALIAGLKRGNGLPEARVLGALFVAHARAAYADADPPRRIVPLPLSYRRRAQRGYNQAALLAAQIGRRLAIPVDYRSLRRIRHTPAQHRLSRSRRAANLRRAFRAAPLEPVRYALVDDVMTTGSTVRAAAQAMLAAGAASVHVWVTARTPTDTLRGP